MINIKPHHFVDIIKLYGAGIDSFVPDEEYGHSFYSIGNEILKNPDMEMNFTIDCDDICTNCKFREGKICTDKVNNFKGYISKDHYNKMLDKSLISHLGLDISKVYTAREYCELLYHTKNIIFLVWTLETSENIQKRYELFCEGCCRYLNM